jgi:hypothetical protein
MSDDSPTPDLLLQVQADLQTWRHDHPQATFAEIEAAVEAHLGVVRAVLLKGTTDAEPPLEPAVCPTCGTALQSRGWHSRDLRGPGEARVHLERPYASCPVCRQGLFPPR